jgi:hypothetical protein
MAHTTIEGQLINTPHNFINLLDGGDMTTNPFQRNIPGLASAGTIASPIGSTATYFADRWFMVGGASSSILASLLADTSVAGFNQSLQMTRSSGNANTAALTLGQVLESADCIRCQGQELTFSFWARTAANYSGGPLTVQLVASTGTNQSAASLVAGTWSGQANVISATQALTGTMARYQFSGFVPATATQLGVLLSWTPSGTAGAADGIIVNGFQLEIGNLASPYEHRDVQVELEICQRYAWVIPEPAAGVIVGGAVAVANSQVFYLATPVQLYKAPSVSVSAGSFKVAAAAAAAAATGFAAGTTHTPNAISLVSTLTETVGLAATLQGGGGTGYVIASADF